uniref:Uncharacterized protein n=1 Tax=Setaria italica TaxID=4555 RepID=K4A3R3_SETIT
MTTAVNHSCMSASPQLKSVSRALQPPAKSVATCQLMLTPQKSPQGMGLGTAKRFWSAHGSASLARLPNGMSSAKGGSSIAGAVVLQDADTAG